MNDSASIFTLCLVCFLWGMMFWAKNLYKSLKNGPVQVACLYFFNGDWQVSAL